MTQEILAKLRESEQQVGAPEGLFQRQIAAESSFNPQAVSPAGAQGLAQMLPSTVNAWSSRVGRKLDPFNEDDAILMQRLTMEENFKKFGSWEAATAAYHGGWDRAQWGDKTRAYVSKLFSNNPAAQAAFDKEYAKRTVGIAKYVPAMPELRSGYDWNKLGDELYREFRDNATAHNEFWAGVGGTAKESVAGGVGLTAAVLQLAVDPIFKPAAGTWVKDKEQMRDFTASEYEYADDSQSPEEFAFRVNKIQVRRMAAEQMAKYSGTSQFVGGIIADPLGGYGVGRLVSAGMRGIGVGTSAFMRAGKTASAVGSSVVENAVGSAIAVGLENSITGQVTAEDAWINILTGTIAGVGGEAMFGGFVRDPHVKQAMDRVAAKAEDSAAATITGRNVNEDVTIHPATKQPDTVVATEMSPEQQARTVEDAIRKSGMDSTTVEQVSKDTGVTTEVVEKTITEAAQRLGLTVEHGVIARDGAQYAKAVGGLAQTLGKLADERSIARRQGLTSLAEALHKRAQQVEAEAVRKAEAEKLDSMRKLQDSLAGVSNKKAEDVAKHRAVTDLVKVLERRQSDLARIAREDELRRAAEEEVARLKSKPARMSDTGARITRELRKAEDTLARLRENQRLAIARLEKDADKAAAAEAKRLAKEQVQRDKESAVAVKQAALEAKLAAAREMAAAEDARVTGKLQRESFVAEQLAAGVDKHTATAVADAREAAQANPTAHDLRARELDARVRVLERVDPASALDPSAKHSVVSLLREDANDFELEQLELIKLLAGTYLSGIKVAVGHAEDGRNPSAWVRELDGELVYSIRIPSAALVPNNPMHTAVHEFGHIVGFAVLHKENPTVVSQVRAAWDQWMRSVGDDATLRQAINDRFSDAFLDDPRTDMRTLAKIVRGEMQYGAPGYHSSVLELWAEQFVDVISDSLSTRGITLRTGVARVLRSIASKVLGVLGVSSRNGFGIAVHDTLSRVLAGDVSVAAASRIPAVGMMDMSATVRQVFLGDSSNPRLVAQHGGRLGVALGDNAMAPPAFNLPPWTPITQQAQLKPEDLGLHRLPHYDLAIRDPATYTPAEKERAMHAAADIAAIRAKLVTMQRAGDPAGMWNQPDLKERIDGWLTRMPYLTSAAVSMLRSRSPVMRYAAWNLFEKTTTQGVPTATMRAHLEYNKITGSFVNEDNAAYRKYLTARKISLRDRAMDYLFGGNKLRAEFNRLVRLELAERAKSSVGPQMVRNVDPAVKEAADLVGALSTRLRDAQINGEAPGWESLVGLDSTTYVQQRLAPEALVDATEAELAGLAQVLRDQLSQTSSKHQTAVVNGKRVLVTTGPNEQPVMVPWDAEFIDEFVARHLQRARSRAVGGHSTAFELNSGGAIDDVDAILGEFAHLSTQERFVLRGLFEGSKNSHTRHRMRLDMTAPVPGTGKRLLDFYDNNYARLLDQQARKVSADIGCVSVGIGGRAGIASIRDMLVQQGSKDANTNVTRDELLRFDQGVAELYGEPFGDVKSVAINIGMLATSLVRMAGSSVAQVAEIVNVSQHLGITTLLREIMSFNRLRKEAIALANGKPLPAGADPALRSVELVGGFEYGTAGYKNNVPWFDRDSDMVPAVANSVIERVLRAAVDWMYKVNLFRAIHAVQQRFVAGELNSKYIRHMSGDKSFRSHELTFAERSGLTPDFIKRMQADPGWQKVVVKNGEVANFNLADFHPDIAVEYAGILRRQVGVVIQEAFAGERAPYMHNDIGRMFMQFQNYSVLAHEKQLKATLESHGWAMSATIMMAQMLALAPAYMLRVQMNAIGMPEDEKERYLKEALSPAKIALGAINLSSMAGLYPNIFGIAVNQFGPFARDTWAEPYVNPLLAKQGQLFFGGIGAPSVKMVNDWYKVFQPDGKDGVDWQNIARNSFMATLPGYRNIINTLPNGEED